MKENKKIQIVRYNDCYQSAFKSLNEAWISHYFELEEEDKKVLNHPRKYIINQGGEILVALSGKQPVGVCALISIENGDFDFELAKMAVAPEARGRGIGEILGKKAIEIAKERGAKKIFIESNTILRPAIQLYEKLGFKKITGRNTPYKRGNIQMELSTETYI